MNWIAASISMFISSVVLYLCIRKGKDLSFSASTTNLAMFAVPTVWYGVLALWQKQSLILPLSNIVLLALVGIVCAYAGNVFSLISMKLAPNPGYSLMISKSYVVLTAVASIFLFHAELTIKSSFAIFIIIGFASLILSSSKTEKKYTSQTIWILYALGAFFAWGGLALASKYFLNIGISVITRLFYVSLFSSFCILLESAATKNKIIHSITHIPLFLAISISSVLFNYSMQIGYQSSPNPGYINAVNAASISALTVASSILFGDELTKRKLIGVLGVTIGLILLFL